MRAFLFPYKDVDFSVRGRGGGGPLGPALDPLMDHASLWLNIEHRQQDKKAKLTFT